jgi:hypothetical protein
MVGTLASTRKGFIFDLSADQLGDRIAYVWLFGTQGAGRFRSLSLTFLSQMV